jgi:hypothetical protein
MHGARQDGESIFFADAVEGGDSFEHGGSPEIRRHLNPIAVQMQMARMAGKTLLSGFVSLPLGK